MHGFIQRHTLCNKTDWHYTPDSNQNKLINRFNGLVNSQIKILRLFIHTRIVPNMYECIEIVILGISHHSLSLRGKGAMSQWWTRLSVPNIVPNIVLHMRVIQVWKTREWVTLNDSFLWSNVFVNCCFKSCFPCAWINMCYYCSLCLFTDNILSVCNVNVINYDKKCSGLT